MKGGGTIEPLGIGIIGLVVSLLLICLGLPIAISFLLVGAGGLFWLKGWGIVWVILKTFPFTTIGVFDWSVVPFFVLMGAILAQSGVGRDIFTGFRYWLGHIPGGVAASVIACCAALGTCMGASTPVAAIAAQTGYPEMKRYGYDPELALGVCASSGTLALIIPPSVGIVIYALLAAQSIGKCLIAGIFPGILVALLYIVMVGVRTKLNPSLAPPQPPASWRLRLLGSRALIPAAIMFGAVIGGIYLGVFTPTEAGGIGVVVALAIVLVLRRITWSKLGAAILETVGITVLCMMLVLGITFMTRLLSYTGVAPAFTELALTFPSPVITLLLIGLVYLVLGMFVGALGMVMMTVPVFVPAIISLGYDPIWFGIFVLIMGCIGIKTPPVAVDVYVVQAIVKEVPIERAFKAILPFLGCDIAAIVILYFFPQIATFLPNMMAG